MKQSQHDVKALLSSPSCLFAMQCSSFVNGMHLPRSIGASVPSSSTASLQHFRTILDKEGKNGDYTAPLHRQYSVFNLGLLPVFSLSLLIPSNNYASSALQLDCWLPCVQPMAHAPTRSENRRGGAICVFSVLLPGMPLGPPKATKTCIKLHSSR